MAQAIVEELKHAVVVQPVGRRVPGEPIAGEPIQSSVVGANPERAVVFGERANMIANETVALCVTGEHSML
jgi:hypothetical protein